jgi:hypothetical protein
MLREFKCGVDVAAVAWMLWDLHGGGIEVAGTHCHGGTDGLCARLRTGMVEYHKRWDPIYKDARNRINTKLGDCAFFQSFMSQPKFQLETFKAWVGCHVVAT